MNDLSAIVANEVQVINRTFRGCNVKAWTKVEKTVVAGSSFIAYNLDLDAQTLPRNIKTLLPKLQEELSNSRRKATRVRLREMPLAIEVDHPQPAPLPWDSAKVLGRYDTALAGRNYSVTPPRDDTVDLDVQTHILVSGRSGSGKSTLVRMLLSTLALRTDPDMLQVYLIDLKKADLVPFKALPHVVATSFDPLQPEKATALVNKVYNIMCLRNDIDGEFYGPRIVLVIDELAQLPEAGLETLGKILSVGRSVRINVIAATQSPKKELIGDKANYTVRFTGRVADAHEAVTATGQKQSGAELLPGRGAFLRSGDGPDTYRIQAYKLDTPGVEQLVDAARQRWGKRDGIVSDRPMAAAVPPVPVYQYRDQAPVLAENWPIRGGTTGIPVSVPVQRPPVPVQVVQVVQPGTGAMFPIVDRELTAAEAEEVRAMYANGVSKNKIITAVWGDTTNKPKRLGRLNMALGLKESAE